MNMRSEYSKGDELRIPVEEFTSVNLITATEDTNLVELKKMMRDGGVRHIPVVRNDEAVGLISERDLDVALSIATDATQVLAEKVMVEVPFRVEGSETLDEVALIMSREKVGSAIVNDKDGKLLGIFTSTDALNALVEILRGDDL